MAAAGGADRADILEIGTAEQVQEELARILEANPDVNQVFEGGNTILHRLAVNPNALPLLQTFLKNPVVNVNIKNTRGLTPALAALMSGSIHSIPSVLLLLKDGRTDFTLTFHHASTLDFSDGSAWRNGPRGRAEYTNTYVSEILKNLSKLFALYSTQGLSLEERDKIRFNFFDIFFSKNLGSQFDHETKRHYFKPYSEFLKQRLKNINSLKSINSSRINSAQSRALGVNHIVGSIGSFMSGRSGPLNSQIENLKKWVSAINTNADILSIDIKKINELSLWGGMNINREKIKSLLDDIRRRGFKREEIEEKLKKENDYNNNSYNPDFRARMKLSIDKENEFLISLLDEVFGGAASGGGGCRKKRKTRKRKTRRRAH